MRQLLPEALADVDPVALYEADDRPVPDGRPWVLTDMVASVDGGTAVAGRSRGLGSAGDHLIFHGLRGLADVVLAGASTVRAERYGPPKVDDATRERRRRRGQPALPKVAVVSASLYLDPQLPMFTDPANRPIVVTTTDADADRKAELAEVADIVEAGSARVDMADAMALLRADHGAAVVTCEGGPTLNGALLAAAVLDEVCLSMSAKLIGGVSNRVLNGSGELVVDLQLQRVLEEDGMLFLRYLV